MPIMRGMTRSSSKKTTPEGKFSVPSSQTLNRVLNKVISTQDIERKAYEFYLQRGGQHGYDWEDWFKAEKYFSQKNKF